MKRRWPARAAAGLAAVLAFTLTPVGSAQADSQRLPLPACSTYILVYRTGPLTVRVPAQNSGGNLECILAVGNQGDGVRQLQRSLNVCYNQGLTVDGVFGTRTRDALVRVQRSIGTDADGGYGPNTRNAMLHQAQQQTTCGRY